MRKNHSLTPAQKMDAREALEILEGIGITLTEAARVASAGKRALRRISVQAAADLFLREKLSLRPATSGWYLVQIDALCGSFGARMMDEVSRADFREWLAAEQTGASGRASRVRAIKAFWRWSLAHDPALAVADVTAGTSGQVARKSADVAFLSVAECGAIMADAGEYQSALALMLFAGVRPDEVRANGKPALSWRCVNVAEKIIRIPGEVAKTGRARLIEGLPGTLWAWLKPKDGDAPVCPYLSTQAVRRAKQLAGYGKGRAWPHDALRHTFATYHVAAYNDPGKCSMLMGHEGNPTMLHRHYRGLASKTDALKFWALRP